MGLLLERWIELQAQLEDHLQVGARDELGEHAAGLLEELAPQHALLELEARGDARQVPDGLDRALDDLEHAVLDYKHLQFLPSQLANASLLLANLTLRKADPWNFTLQYYSRVPLDDFRDCARNLLDFTTLIANSKYQAIRRKYGSSKYNEVARLSLPTDLTL